MTDEVMDAQDRGAEEEAGLPTPTISAGSGGAGSAQSGFDVEALAEKLLEKLEPVIDNKVDARYKSGKDVRFNKVDEIYEWVKASGGDPDKIRGALAESSYANRLEKLEAALASGGAVGTATNRGAEALEKVATEILSKAGIKFGDPIVGEWSGKEFASEEEAIQALATSVTKRVRQGDVSQAASSSSGSTSANVEGETYESLAQELAGMRGKFDEKTNKRRAEIQEKMGELESGLSFVERKFDVFG